MAFKQQEKIVLNKNKLNIWQTTKNYVSHILLKWH